MKKIFILLHILLVSFSASAQISCADIKSGSANYHENMERLVQLIGVVGYFNRYHESVALAVCARKFPETSMYVDKGFVSAQQVAAMKRILLSTPEKRSEAGKTYQFTKNTFEKMGLCSACADNVAQHYIHNSNSKCAKIAKRSLEGDPEAVNVLLTFPGFCEWKY